MANKALRSTSPTEYEEREACSHCGSTEGCYQIIKFEQRHDYNWDGDGVCMWEEEQTGATILRCMACNKPVRNP